MVTLGPCTGDSPDPIVIETGAAEATWEAGTLTVVIPSQGACDGVYDAGEAEIRLACKKVRVTVVAEAGCTGTFYPQITVSAGGVTGLLMMGNPTTGEVDVVTGDNPCELVVNCVGPLRIGASRSVAEDCPPELTCGEITVEFTVEIL